MRLVFACLLLFLGVVSASAVVRAGSDMLKPPLFIVEGVGSELQTERVSVSATGAQGNSNSLRAQISADGRWVVFSSFATNLTPDQGFTSDIFLHDRDNRAILNLSGGMAGGANGNSTRPRPSADGGRVVWESVAFNLVPSDTNGVADIFLSDIAGGTRTRLSVNDDGIEGNGESGYPDISGDGTRVVFESVASNLVLSDTNGVSDIFVTSPPNPPLHYGEGGNPFSPLSATERGDGGVRLAGAEVIRISVSSEGEEGNGASFGARISGNGRYVVFSSSASNLVANDTNGADDVFVHDLETGITERVSVRTGGGEGALGSGGGALSADGRYAVFDSGASLVSQDDNGFQDVYRHDRTTGTTELVTRLSAGETNGDSIGAALSADGRYVSFMSVASNLVANDGNFSFDIFRRDMQGSEILRFSISSFGLEGDDASQWASMSADGMAVAYESRARNLVAGDSNELPDIFVSALVELPPTPTATPISTATLTPTPTATLPHRLELPLVMRNSGIGNRNITIAGDRMSGWATITDDNQAVAFASDATTFTLLPVQHKQIYQWKWGEIELVTLGLDGNAANDGSDFPRYSGDGSTIVFQSRATNLVAGDSNGTWDIIAYDVASREMTIVSRASSGMQANGASTNPVVSADGRYVAFTSRATNLGVPISTDSSNLYWHDRVTGETRLITKQWNGDAARGVAYAVDISADGQTVLFDSDMRYLDPYDTGPLRWGTAYLWERATDTISRISEGPNNQNPDNFSWAVALSADGRYVMFSSGAENITPDDTHDGEDIFIYDRQTGGYAIPQLPEGYLTNGSRRGDISDDGRYSVYSAWRADASGKIYDLFLFDRERNTTRQLTSVGYPADGDSEYAQISGNGNMVVFTSDGTHGIPEDTNGVHDIFWLWAR